MLDQPDLFGMQRPKIPSRVLDLFDKLTDEVRRTGMRRYSADAILHRIRWHFQVERGERDFKCNNNWTAALARWYLYRHPDAAGFFQLRSSPGTVPGVLDE